MKIRLFLIIISIGCISTGCKKEALDNPIDSDILVSVATLEDEIFINAETETIYGCCNLSIIFDMSTVERKISIDFTCIFMPDICLTALGPAKSSISLGQLSPGEYTIVFSLNNIDTRAYLSVGSNTTLTIPEERNVNIK